MAFQIANQTSTSLLRPIPTPGPWVRPADWLTITDTPGEVQYLMSDAVSQYTAVSTAFTRGATGNIYIDWGDGIIDTVSTTGATTTNHTYSTGGTPSSLGYNMWKIRVYGDAGTTLTGVNIVNNTAFLPGAQAPSGVLEVVYGDGTQTSGFGQLFANGPRVNYLQYVKLPATTNVGATQGFFRLFFGNGLALEKVVLPTSATVAASYTDAFSGCVKLKEVIFPANQVFTSLAATFSGCVSLTSVTWPTVSQNIGFSSTFSGCTSLTSIDIPPGINTAWTSAFTNCRSLLSIEVKSLPGATIDFSSAFSGCSSLEYIKFPASGASGCKLNLASAFQNCYNLKNIVLPANVDVTSFASAFSGCNSLATASLPLSVPSLTSFASAFTNCYTLQSITLPIGPSGAISFANTFQNCFAIASITIPTSYTIASLSNTFTDSSNLRTVVLPNNAQNSLDSMLNMCSGCSTLSSITLPTSMTALTSLIGTFRSCASLTSVVFPSALNSVASINSLFLNCSTLRSVTYPTSMSSLTRFDSAHQGCLGITNVTLPATVSASTTSMISLFNGCTSLNTFSLPSTQTTGLTILTSAFLNTYGATGSTNLDKLGNPATGAATFIDASSNTATQLPTWDLYGKFSKLDLSSTVGVVTKVSSVRLRNTGSGQWAGTSPQISVAYTSMSTAALVTLFNDIAAQGNVVSKTINITGAVGAAGLTAADRLIITSKGWAITG